MNDTNEIIKNMEVVKGLISYYKHRKAKCNTYKFSNVVFSTRKMQLIINKYGTKDEQEKFNFFTENSLSFEMFIENKDFILIIKNFVQKNLETRTIGILFYNDFNFIKKIFKKPKEISLSKLNMICFDTWENFKTTQIKIEKCIKPILKKNIPEEIVKDMKNFFQNTQLYIKNKIPHIRGLMLYGYPGNGKTSLIKYIITQFPSIYKVSIDSTSLRFSFDLSQYLKETFNGKPIIFIIEDIDETYQTRREVTNFIDGISSVPNIYFIATTNKINNIDVSLKDRPGRFDWLIKIDKPEKSEREKLLKMWFKDLSKTELADYVKLTKGFSASYFKELFIEVTTKNTTIKKSIDNIRLKLHETGEETSIYMS